MYLNETKTSAITFAATSFQESTMINFFYPELSLVMKPLSMYLGMLTEVTQESGGVRILMQ
jgi:hypothetical protein